MAGAKRSARDASKERAELLARACADFASFCRTLVWIAPKDGVRTTLKFNPIQAMYERERSSRDVVLKPRQIGFTTLELARDVYRFVTGRGARILIVCQSVADAAPPWKKVSQDVARMLEGLRGAGMDLQLGTDTESMWTLPSRDSTLQILEAGASEQAASKKARGGTFTRLHLTEAAFYEHAERTTNAMFEGVPSLPGTEIVVESTPNGVGNWFHELFVGAQAGANGFKPHFFAWFQDPTYALDIERGEVVEPETDREHELVATYGIRPEQLKWYRRKVAQKGQELVDQEYASDPLRCFLSSGRSFFDLSRLEAMAPLVRPPVEQTRHLRVWVRPAPLERYVIGVDPAEGLGDDGDWSVATVWHRQSHAHVATLRSQLQANPFADELVPLARRYNNAEIVVERNKGMAVLSALECRSYANVYHDEQDKPGFATTTASRPVLLEQLAHAVRDGSFFSNDIVLLTEMKAFVVDPKTGKPHAPGKRRKGGTGDDAIFSAAGAWLAMQRPALATTRVFGARASASMDEFSGSEAAGRGGAF